MATTANRSRRVAACLAVVSTLVLTACGGATPVETAPAAVGGEATVSTEIAWSTCGERLECATVTMPLDWGDPSGETIDLSVIRHPASRPDARIGTIFTNPGGPGESGVGFVRGAGDELDAWSDGRFDWIGWDPRGTGGSAPVDCFDSDADAAAFWTGVTIPSTVDESEAFARRAIELATRCGDVMGDVLSHLSTTDTVRDLDALRGLLGEPSITYVGLSYGTLIGQVYANLFPDRVRAMLLDGIVDPVASMTDAESRIANNASSADDVFDQFLSTCEAAGPARCALAAHGERPADRVDRLFEQIRAAPTGDGLRIGDLQWSAFAALRDPSLWPAFAEHLDAAVEGDPSALVHAAQQMATPSAWAGVTTSAAISCADAPASRPLSDWPSVVGDLGTESRIAGEVLAWSLWAPCASNWRVESTDGYAGPWDAETAVPILLIGTVHDPNTSYENAVRSEQLLGNAVLLTHEGFGHLSTNDSSACVEAWRVRYLVDLQTPPAGTVCTADATPFSSG